MTVTVSAKGQLVIPAKLRKRYHIRPGSRIEFLDTGQQLVIVPVPKNAKDAFEASRGILKGYSTKEFLQWRRRERQCGQAELG